jgi:hypothetical protein
VELSKIIIGLIVAVFLVFLKDAHSKAQKQLIIATRLRAYLLYWQGVVLDKDLFSIFYQGIEWNKEIDALIKSGAKAEDLVKLNDDKKTEMEGLKKHLLSEDGLKTLSRDGIEKILSKIPINSTEHILGYVKTTGQNLIDGKTFISDEEASYLGVYTAQTSIELKMELISIMNSANGLLIVAISSVGEFDYKEHADEIMELVWKGIVVSKHIDTLTKKAQYISSKSVFDLTIKNLGGEL